MAASKSDGFSFEIDRVLAAEHYSQHAQFQLKQGIDLIEIAALQRGDTVIDVGCGTGELTRMIFESTGARVLGVDPDSQRIAHCLQLKQQLSLSGHDSTDLEFAVGEACNLAQLAFKLGIVPCSVDVIFVNHVIHWISDKETFFRQALQLLTPGRGRLVIQSPERDIKLLTRLIKLSPLTDAAVSRAIHITGRGKLCTIAAKVGLDSQPNHHVLHSSLHTYRHRFESSDELQMWMHGSTHGAWRPDAIELERWRRFVEDEFESESHFARKLEAHMFRLVWRAPTAEDVTEFEYSRKRQQHQRQQQHAQSAENHRRNVERGRQRAAELQQLQQVQEQQDRDDDDTGIEEISLL